MELLEIMKNRRSVRSYTGETISEEKLEKILQAGLLAPTGHNSRSFEFVVVRNKEMLEKLSHARVGSAKMLAGADCAIAVIGDESKTVVWVEDCSIAMMNMHLMADSLELGSCWIQCRCREAENGQSTEEYVRGLLKFPENMKLEAILSLGVPAAHAAPHTVEELELDKIHKEVY